MPILAINGAPKIRTKLFPRYNNISQNEIDAVSDVMKEGTLSKYLGVWCDDFYGGNKIQEFEAKWSKKFDAQYSIAVNSNSSGLIAALGACGVGLGDEVIVSPYSMSISATAPLFYNATPVFCDLDKNTYSYDLIMLEKLITKDTKAIIVVHIFGCPSNMDEINKIAKKYKLFVIEDCAQAPGATYKGKQVGTLGDIGVFSLNYHKHIHTGEGGMCVTNNKILANKMHLIRNHAESIVDNKGEIDLVNMLGYNFRLTEIQAAIGIEQLKKLDNEVKIRQEYASIYNKALCKFNFIETTTFNDRTHSYYVQSFKFNENKAGVTRDKYIQAVKAELAVVEHREDEGVPIGCGYVKPLYLLSIFQKKLAYNKPGFAFKDNISYHKGLCPNVEELHYKELFTHDFTRSPLSINDVNDIVNAYVKVANNINEIK